MQPGRIVRWVQAFRIHRPECRWDCRRTGIAFRTLPESPRGQSLVDCIMNMSSELPRKCFCGAQGCYETLGPGGGSIRPWILETSASSFLRLRGSKDAILSYWASEYVLAPSGLRRIHPWHASCTILARRSLSHCHSIQKQMWEDSMKIFARRTVTALEPTLVLRGCSFMVPHRPDWAQSTYRV